MKKILLIALATMAMSASSFAASITLSCGFNLYSSTGVLAIGSATRTCPDFNIAGQQVTDVTLEYGVDYVYSNPNISPAMSVSVNFDPIGNNLFTNDTITVTRTGLGVTKDAQSPLNAIGFADLVPNVDNFLAGPSATFAVVGFSGPIEGISASMFVTYTYDRIPTNEGNVPEPTTIALIGAGLVGLAAASRRRR